LYELAAHGVHALSWVAVQLPVRKSPALHVVVQSVQPPEPDSVLKVLVSHGVHAVFFAGVQLPVRYVPLLHLSMLED
jgi:hypothetical protein